MPQWLLRSAKVQIAMNTPSVKHQWQHQRPIRVDGDAWEWISAPQPLHSKVATLQSCRWRWCSVWLPLIKKFMETKKVYFPPHRYYYVRHWFWTMGPWLLVIISIWMVIFFQSLYQFVSPFLHLGYLDNIHKTSDEVIFAHVAAYPVPTFAGKYLTLLLNRSNVIMLRRQLYSLV